MNKSDGAEACMVPGFFDLIFRIMPIMSMKGRGFLTLIGDALR